MKPAAARCPDLGVMHDVTTLGKHGAGEIDKSLKLLAKPFNALDQPV